MMWTDDAGMIPSPRQRPAPPPRRKLPRPKNKHKEPLAFMRRRANKLPSVNKGDIVIIHPRLKQSQRVNHGRNPTCNSSMLRYVGMRAKVTESNQDDTYRVYLRGMDNGSSGVCNYTWHREWVILEELAPPLLIHTFQKTTPIYKSLTSMAKKDITKWTSDKGRVKFGWTSRTKDYNYMYKLPTRTNPLSQTRLRTYTFSRELHNLFQYAHTCFINKWGCMVGRLGYKNPCPSCFFLGANKDGVIEAVFPLNYNNYEGWSGCGEMPNVFGEDYANGIATLGQAGYTLVGICRIGSFSVHNQSSRGGERSAMANTHSNIKGIVLSIGRDTLMVEALNLKTGRTIHHKYKVLPAVRKGVSLHKRIRRALTTVTQTKGRKENGKSKRNVSAVSKTATSKVHSGRDTIKKVPRRQRTGV